MRDAVTKGSSVLTAILLATLQANCTFITSCPNGSQNTPANTAGSANGGNGGDGGAAPVPMGEWTNVTSNLEGLSSECGNLTSVFAKPDEDLMIAGVAQQGLWASRDGGGSWSAMGTGRGSDTITNRPTALVYDPEDSNRFWESGIYNGPGVFETTDDGKTFTALGDAQTTDLVSVDLSDPDRATLVAGGHETTNTLRRSKDGGKTWTDIRGNLPDTNCTQPLVIDSKTYLVGCGGYPSGPTGIFRTTNSGGSWSNVSDRGGGGAAPIRASDNSIYWPNTGDSGMVRSTDDGRTWTDADPTKMTRTNTPSELPDGRLTARAKDAVIISLDHGATWAPVTAPFPYKEDEVVAGFIYSAQQRAFFVWHSTCGFDGPVPVPNNAIFRYDFDYEQE
jgi:photosystem II stability/assembly factor-like uncharacterized protein